MVDRRGSLSDLELVRSAQAGDRVAMEQLLRRHSDRAWAIARRILGNDADASDATQDALIAIVRSLARFDGRSAFTTWMYRVVTNTCLDELRRRARRPLPSERLPERTLHEVDATDALVIDDALATLSPEFRAAVVLRDLCGLDYAEIATVLSIPIGTVRSRIARARGALAHHIAGNQGEAGVVREVEP
jgi:RNA polymerase sigma-70 factor (ECF subfamily)